MPLLIEPPAGKPFVNWMTEISDGTWLIRISEANGRLTDEGDFVETEVTATILETLKTRAGLGLPSEASDKLTFVVPGGETTVGDVRIQGVIPWTKQPVAGQTYVLFADWDRDAQKLIVGPSSLYEQTSAGFAALLLQGPPTRKKLDGSTEQTIRTIRIAGLQRP
jgi:hypothetical protein